MKDHAPGCLYWNQGRRVLQCDCGLWDDAMTYTHTITPQVEPNPDPWGWLYRIILNLQPGCSLDVRISDGDTANITLTYPVVGW